MMTSMFTCLLANWATSKERFQEDKCQACKLICSLFDHAAIWDSASEASVLLQHVARFHSVRELFILLISILVPAGGGAYKLRKHGLVLNSDRQSCCGRFV